MTALSLVLVLSAAVLHATWNLLAKRVGAGGVPFVWLCATAGTALYMPIAVVAFAVTRPAIGVVELVFLIGSGLLHACYFTLLQHGYRVGDLSVVYPLARGTGPMLSTALAIAFLDERPTAPALSGALLVCVGVIVVGRAGATARGDTRAGVMFGLATGALIATYTLWDRHAVAVLALPPLVLDWTANAVRAAALAPIANRRREVVRELWAQHRREVLGVAVLSPLAYILVLTALAVTPVSYVAPAREASILIGTILGVRLLGEGALLWRLVGAAAIVAGLAGLAIS